MQQLQLIQLSLEELDSRLKSACKMGAAEALAEHHALTAPAAEITKPEAMKLAGFKDNPSFMVFLKRNKIYSSGKRGKFNLYKRDEIVNAPYPKGTHL